MVLGIVKTAAKGKDLRDVDDFKKHLSDIVADDAAQRLTPEALRRLVVSDFLPAVSALSNDDFNAALTLDDDNVRLLQEYGDAEQNGPGCHYVTSAHEITYHDYSTGFRCCADAAE